MLKKLFLLNMLFALCAININAQNLVIKGKVIDAATKIEIEGVNIIYANKYYTKTNALGEFLLKSDIEDGILKISHIGYSPISVPINKSISNNIIELKTDNLNINEVIITTNRREEFLSSIPYSASYVDKSNIQEQPFFTIPDILRNESGISVIRDGVWGTDLTIRGLSRANIVTLIDGHRIETANDIAARFSLIDMNDVERIEVIKGAASSLYGTGATGGVVNIITRNPGYSESLYLTGNLSTGYNSVNNSSLFSSTLMSGGNIWSAKITGSFRKADDASTPKGKLLNSRFKDYSLSGNFNISPFENHTLKLNYQHFGAEDVGIPGSSSLFPRNADVRYPIEKRDFYGASYEIKNISNILQKISVDYSYQNILRDVENIPYQVTRQGVRRINVLKITPGANHHINNAQVQFDLFLSENNYLIAGLDFWSRKYVGERLRYQKIEVYNNANQDSLIRVINRIIAEKPIPDSKSLNYGLFIQDDIKIIKDKLNLTLGARAEKIDISGELLVNPLYEIVDGVRTTPTVIDTLWNGETSNDYSYGANAGIIYNLTNNFDISFNSALSYRSPSLEERFQFIDLGNLVRLGNPQLKAEKGTYLDLGFRYKSSLVNITSSIFSNFLTDLVVEDTGRYEGRAARIKTNIGQAVLYGIDGTLNISIMKDLACYTSLSYVRGEDTRKNESLPQIAPLNGIIGLQYFLMEYVNLDINSIFFDKQNKVAPGEVTTPGYAYFNIALNSIPFRIPGAVIQLNAGVENIFNKEYRNHLATNRGLISVEPGRNIYFKTTIRL